MKVQGRYIRVKHCNRPDDVNEALQNLSVSLNFSLDSGTSSTNCSECPHRLRHSQHEPQRLRSTCPWVWEENISENRYPRKVINARCICRRCIGSNARYQCEPIYTRVKVLRVQGCQNGLLQYTNDEEIVSVGCTCAHRRTYTNLR